MIRGRSFVVPLCFVSKTFYQKQFLLQKKLFTFLFFYAKLKETVHHKC